MRDARDVLPGRPAWRHAGLLRSVARASMLGLGLTACAAHGQVASSADYLARMDGDGDARVSLAEYQAWMGYAFERMDRNGDGVLAGQELPGARGLPVRRDAHLRALAAAFSRQDRDGDGWLDAAELAAPPR
jgi:hypothetical protein